MSDLAIFFDRISDEFGRWRSKNAYYYGLLESFYRYVVPEGSRVLELGSGHGDLLSALKPALGVGIDISPKMVAAARLKHPKLEFVAADADELALEGSFDYVIGADLLGFLPDIQAALERLRSVTQPGTRIVFTWHNILWSPLMIVARSLGWSQPKPYLNWLSKRQLTHLLKISGYEVVAQGRFCLLPIRIPVISDFVNRFIAPLPLVREFGFTNWVVARTAPAPSAAPSVSVIVPARNEKGNIRSCVNRLPIMAVKQEIIFVEGHSKDGTWEEIERIKASYAGPCVIKAYKQTGKGKADAVHLGFAKAEGDILMILDSDLAVAPEDLPRFYAALVSRRAEYVQGTRLIYPMEEKAMRPLNWVGNKFFATVISFLISQDLSDTLCGTKCLWRKDWERIVAARGYFGNFDPFGDFEMIFGAAKLFLKIEEIPVRYRARTYGETQISRWRDGMILLRMTWFAMRKMLFY